MKDELGRLVVPHSFHEMYCSIYVKFLKFQQEHGHGVGPADVEHKSLSNWLKNQRNYMRDYKNNTGDNYYTHYPDYFNLMIDSGVSACNMLVVNQIYSLKKI
jgi:hypothetical protein